MPVFTIDEVYGAPRSATLPPPIGPGALSGGMVAEPLSLNTPAPMVPAVPPVFSFDEVMGVASGQPPGMIPPPPIETLRPEWDQRDPTADPVHRSLLMQQTFPGGIAPGPGAIMAEVSQLQQIGTPEIQQASSTLAGLIDQHGTNPLDWDPQVRSDFGQLMGAWLKPGARVAGGLEKFPELLKLDAINQSLINQQKQVELAANPTEPFDQNAAMLRGAIEHARQSEETWGEWVRDRTPFVGAGYKAGESFVAMNAARRVAAGQGTPEDFDAVGRVIVDIERAREDKPWHKDVLNLLSELPAFGVEFGLTGGAFSGTKKVVTEGIEKLVGEAAERGIGKLASSAAGYTAGAAAQTAATPGRVLESTGRQMERSLELTKDEQGQLDLILKSDTDGFLEALPRGYLDSLIEMAAERSGGALGAAAGKIPGASKLKETVIGQWLSKPGASVGKLDALFKRAGWNGIVGEVLEERVGEVARGATGDYLGTGYGATGKIASGDVAGGLYDISKEAAAFGLMGGAKGLAGRALSGASEETADQSQPPRFRTAQDTAAALTTPEGAAQFAQENPDAARLLSENPSRRQFTDTFGLREEDVGKNLPKPVRDRIAANLQSALGASQAPAEAAPIEEQPAENIAQPPAPIAESPENIAPVGQNIGEEPGSITPPAPAPGAGGVTPPVATAAESVPESPISTQPDSAPDGQAAPTITRADVENTFKGAAVEDRQDGRGWKVRFGSGRAVDVELVDRVDFGTREHLEARNGKKYTDKQWAKLQEVGAKGAFRLYDDGMSLDTIGLIRLSTSRGADSTTLRHEAIHFAKAAGMFSEKEWNTLVEKYSSPDRDAKGQEEDIARASNAWKGGKSLPQTIRKFAKQTLDGLGIKLDAETVQTLLETEEFWARPQPGANPSSQSAGPTAKDLIDDAKRFDDIYGYSDLPATGWRTPVSAGQEATAGFQSAGLPQGMFIALDKPFESTAHDAKKAQKVDIPPLKNVFDPNGLVDPKNRELHGKMWSGVVADAQQSGNFRQGLTDAIRSRGFDAMVRPIDGDRSNRELIVFGERQNQGAAQQPAADAPLVDPEVDSMARQFIAERPEIASGFGKRRQSPVTAEEFELYTGTKEPYDGFRQLWHDRVRDIVAEEPGVARRPQPVEYTPPPPVTAENRAEIEQNVLSEELQGRLPEPGSDPFGETAKMPAEPGAEEQTVVPDTGPETPAPAAAKPSGDIDRVLGTRTQNGPIEQTMRDVMIRGGNKSYEGWLKFAANAEAAQKFDDATMRQAWDTVRAGLHPGMRDAVTPATEQAESTPASAPEAPQPPPAQSERDELSEFADRVNEAARAATTGKFGPNKVFISHVWNTLKNDEPFRSLGLDGFKQRLTDANRAGLLALSRADLVEAMDPADVDQSETPYLNATFHFIQIPEASSQSAAGPRSVSDMTEDQLAAAIAAELQQEAERESAAEAPKPAPQKPKGNEKALRKRLKEIRQAKDMAYDMAINDKGRSLAKLEAEERQILEQLGESKPLGDIVIKPIFGGKETRIPAKTPIRKKADEANQEVAEAFDEFKDVLKDLGLGMNPWSDPKLIAATSKLTAKLVKAGILNFADAVDAGVRYLGAETMRKLGPTFERAWNAVRRMPGGEQMDEAGRVADILADKAPKSTATPEEQLSDAVAAALDEGTAISAARFFSMADEAYGGTRAEGTYGPSEAYDALELGVNKHLKGKTDPTTGSLWNAQREVARLADLVRSLPSQTNRSGNKDVLQQFSTPPHYAYAVAWLANITPADTVLEPSAGTGDLAVQAMNAGATVYGNELDPRRASLLQQLGPADVFLEDAEQIHNSLPGRMPSPTVVLMNPPFSHAGERMGTKTISGTDLKHIDAALDLLAPNGRLVAIIGAGLHGETKTLKSWLAKTGARYNLRAHVTVARDVYKGYGTTFPTRVLVIDKTAPSGETVTGASGSVADLLLKLKDVRNDRTLAAEPQPAQSGGEVSTQQPQSGRGPAVSVQPAAGGMDAGERTGGDSGDLRDRDGTAGDRSADVRVESEERPGSSGDRGGRVQPEREVADGSRTAGDREPAGAEPARPPVGDQPAPESAEPVERLTVEKAEKRERRGELTESLFEPYRPAKAKFSGAKKHPASIVESAPMAAVDPPDPTYRPSLPKDVVDKGLLSEIQLETVAYAGQAHEKMLPDGTRQGFMVGDGTGVGKGRQIAGVILDNWQQGRKKAVWISVSQKLFEDAKGDWSALGGDAKDVFNLSKIKTGAPIKGEQGIVYSTYNTLTAKSKDSKTRLDQIVEWLGEDFDGVIAFDEAHKMANAVSTSGGRGQTTVSDIAVKGLELQSKLPKARVLYVSATAATEVRNLAYAQRLGLWGINTAFSTVQDFITKITDGGVAAMELVARDMKAMGRYLARNISFNDGTEKGTVTFRRLEQALSTQQRGIYDKLAEAWQHVLKDIDAALDIADGKTDTKTKSRILSQFWGTHQRFFNQIITAMQLPAVITDIEKQLAAGHSAVIQLTNTFGSATERALGARKQSGETEDDLSDFDITPREMLIGFVERSFPTMQFEQYRDPNGNTKSRPAYSTEGFTAEQQAEYAGLSSDGKYEFRKKHGKQIQNREAVAMRDQLLDELGSISVPASPIDYIINHFGEGMVAEVTGRKRRVIEKVQEDGSLKTVVDKRGSKANQAEIDRFMAGKKRILIFSEAGGTGASYHASLTAANQQKRVHYLTQAGWKADAAVQGLGRSHRSNQKQAPEFVLVMTDLKGQKRFISTIARRLAQLGALTKGERKAGSTGVFSAADNLESTEAKDALTRFYRDLAAGRLEAISIEEFEAQTGLRLRDQNGQMMQTLPPITQFLNRLLSMNVDTQNAVFEAFDNRLKQVVDEAQRAGRLDQGTETLRADSIKKLEERTVYTHETGAETKYVKLKIRNKFEPVDYQDAVRTAGGQLLGFYRRPSTGRIFAAEATANTRTDRDGTVHERVRMHSPRGVEYADRSELKDGYEEVGRADSKDIWDAEFAATPTFKDSTTHLITGVILPIWDRLAGRPQVRRMLTDDGEQLLGRVVVSTEIKKVLKALGAEATQEAIPPAQLLERLIQGEITATLTNGWKIKGSRVQGERRVEITGPDFQSDRELNVAGVFKERIGSKTRYFIPTGPNGIDVFKAVTKAHPVMEVDELAEAGTHALKSPQTIPVSMEKGGAEISNHAIIRTMSEEFDVPIRAGRVRGTAAGIYKVKPEVVRMKSRFGGDLGVASHEVAHHIDKKHRLVKGLPRALRQELGTLDYEPERARDFEGFAEFIRLFLTHDDAAEQLTPQFHEHFTRTWLPAHKDVRAKLEKIKSLIDRWRQQGAGARIQANISKTGKPARPIDVPKLQWFGEQFRSWANRIYNAQKDEGHWLNVFQREAKAKGYSPKPGESPFEVYEAFTQTGPSFAKSAIEHGVFSLKTMQKIGPSLHEVFADIDPAEYDTFVSWLYARHAIESWGQGKHPGISLADAEFWHEQHKNPRYEEAAQKFTAFNDALIDMLAEAGVIAEGTAEIIKEAYETYIPLHRVRDSVKGRAGIGRKLVNLPDPLKRRHGADLPIIDPFQATVERAVRFYERAAQQQVVERTIEVANKVDGMGGWIERVPPAMVRTTVPLQEIWPTIADKLDAAGIDPDLLEGVDTADIINIWRPDYFYKGDQPIARVLRAGEPELYQFDKDLFAAVSGMNYFRLPYFLDIVFAKPVRLMKMGFTGLSMSFGLKNPLRDYFTWLFQKKHGKDRPGEMLSPPAMVATYIYSHVQKLRGKDEDPFVVLWEQMAGPLAQPLGLDRKRIRQAVENAVADSTKRRLMNIAKHPVELVRDIIGITEVGPRLAEFRAVLEENGYTRETLKSGDFPPRAVLVQAINAANDVTVNFKRQGWMGKWFNQVIPFWNAPIEGFDKFVRTWRDNPKRTFILSAVMAAGTIAYVLQKDDEDWYEEAPPWLKYGFWTLTDDNGTPVARVPRPHEWGWTISAGVEAILNAYRDRDPKEFARYAKQAAESLVPDPKPALVAPSIETYFNYDTFRNQPIVNRALENLKPEDQANPHTTRLARGIGQWLGVSPAKVEHWLDQHSGGLFRGIAKPTESMLAGEEMGGADLPGIGGFALRRDYSVTLESFYDERDKLTREVNSAKLKGTELDAETPERLHLLNRYADMMTELRRGVQGVANRDQRFSHEKYIIGLAREAMGKSRLDRYPSPFRRGEVLPPAVQAIVDDVNQSAVYLATDPDAEDRRPAESAADYDARVAKREASIEKAVAHLREIGMTLPEAEAAFLQEWNERRRKSGYKIETNEEWDRRKNGTYTGKRTAYGERLDRLRKIFTD